MNEDSQSRRRWIQTLHACPIPTNREKKLYMDKKPSIVLISTSETDRGLEKVRNRKPGTPIDCPRSSQCTLLASEREAHADAIVGHFNGNDLSHSKAEAREGFQVGKDLRDLLVS